MTSPLSFLLLGAISNDYEAASGNGGIAEEISSEGEGLLWPRNGLTYYKAERPVSDELAAVGAPIFSGAATADCRP